MLAAGEYLIAFASGLDVVDPAGNLHTDFQLSAESEYLALVEPNGVTIASEFAPAYPPQFRDVSYGRTMNAAATTLVDSGAEVSVLIPSDGSLGTSWTAPGFVPDGAWITETAPGVPATAGVGFETTLTTPGLVASWPLNDDVGSTTAFDATGNGHNGGTFGGVAFGATGATANTGGAISLTGSGVINVPHSPDINPTSFTVALWARVTGGTGFRSAITSRYDGLVFGGGNLDGYILYAGSDNRWQFWTGDGESAVDTWDTLTGPNVVVNEWTHLAISFDVATNTKQLYVNGALAASSTTQGYKPVTNSARALHIGGGGDDGNSFRFVGNIDDVGLFDRALDSAAIQQIMASGVPEGGVDVISPEVHTNVAAEMLGVNASAFVRVPFDAAAPGDFDRLLLRMKYDDGFVAYLNGHEIARRNAPTSPTWDSAAIASRSDDEAIEFEDINVTSALPFLLPGANVLAVHGLNFSASDGDFLISPELIAQATTIDAGDVGYFTTPTPAGPNAASTSAVPPTIAEVAHSPNVPTTSEPLVVTARIGQTTQAVAGATLVYRVMYGAEASVAMTDDGLLSDAIAGDGIYTGAIPAGVAAAGQMLRYYVRAQDIAGAVERAPRVDDLSGTDQSEEYFGTVIANPGLTSQLPIFQWFTTNVASSHTRTGARASVFYNGEFYDNIFVRQRGQATNSSISQKFDFNDDHLFSVNDSAGRVEEINVNAQGTDPTYLRQTLAFEAWRDVGVPSSESFLMRMQVNGAFDRVGIYVEQVDDLFLDRYGLDPEGALYKFVQRTNLNPVFSDTTTGIEKKTRLDEDFSDIQAVVTGLNLPTPEQRRNFLFDNFDVPDLVNYLAVRAIIQDADDIRKNFYLYRDTNGDGEWSVYPWDNDFTFGIRGDGGPNLDHPFFGEQEHPKLNANQWNVLLDVVFDLPETRDMYLRRLRTLMDERLKPTGTPADELVYEKRLTELYAQAAADLALHGVTQSTVNGILPFFAEQRNDFYGTHSIDNAGGGGIVGTLVPEFISQNVKWFVPSNNALGTTWTAPSYNDTAWKPGQTGIGYETTAADYVSILRTSVDPKRGNDQGPLVTCSSCTSTFARIPFTIPDQATLDQIAANGLTLRMKYDDGFVAFINGTEVRRQNVPGTTGTLVGFDALGTNHDDAAAVVFENFNISAFVNQLIIGTNVLAIQGVNQTANSSDMLILPELVIGSPAVGDVAGIPHAQVAHPAIQFGGIEYAPASADQDEEYIELVNPTADAVDLSAWRLAGGVEFTFELGTVLRGGGVLYVSPKVQTFRARTAGPRGGQGLLVVGNYSGHISSFGETIELVAPDGAVIASVTTPSTPSPQQQFLRITELMYHPADPSPAEQAAGFDDGDLFEFIELRNVGSEPLSLSGVNFSRGVLFTFSVGASLPAGGYGVLVSNAAAFAARYGSEVNVLGQYAGNLSNGGEAIKFDDVDGGTILDFAYDDIGVDWHPATDGGGYSLVIRNDLGSIDDWSLGTAWRASGSIGGSPGSSDRVAGDVDGNLRVDLIDLAILQRSIGTLSGATRDEGDLDGDGAVTGADAAILALNFGRSSAAPGAPLAVRASAFAASDSARPTVARAINARAQRAKSALGVSARRSDAPHLSTGLVDRAVLDAAALGEAASLQARRTTGQPRSRTGR
ncbi:MAG: hypothetical protein DCC68_22190 [Planctomycetota bacterium]|nr:MAG: hypothetical protein DCC68_22190 [Planctomycetota bacterium]